jgi:hypothetical protein
MMTDSPTVLQGALGKQPLQCKSRTQHAVSIGP